jgi:SPW repeat-containing protein
MKNMTWADIALGLWLILSPLVLGYTLTRGLFVAEEVGPGAFLIITSIWMLVTRHASLKVNWLQGLDGLWLIIGSFALLFSHFPYAAVNSLIVGVLAIALELVSSLRMTGDPATMV